jgi:thiosulfate dehydrogenase
VRRPLALVAVVVAGCSAGSEPALERGTELFASPALSSAAANRFACATCHALGAAGDPQSRLPGYSLHDVTARPSWWGGAYATLLDAVNECLVQFMGGDRLSPDDTDGRALLVYLESQSPDAQAPALPLTVLGTVDGAYLARLAGGDAGRGATLYGGACAPCHGALHTGAGRLGPDDPIIPDDTLARHGTGPMTGARAFTVEKVRHGNFFSVGGRMPPYSLQALADAELADVLAYITASAPGF